MSTPSIGGIPDAVRAAFNTWLTSEENKNRMCFDEDRYLEYKVFVIFPNSKLLHDLKDKEDKQRWSNQKCDALAQYEIVNGALYQKAKGKYPQSYD